MNLKKLVLISVIFIAPVLVFSFAAKTEAADTSAQNMLSIISLLQDQIFQLQLQLKNLNDGASVTVVPNTAAYIKVVAPNGGERLRAGNTTTIKWKSSVRKELIGIDLYAAGGNTNLTEDQMQKISIKGCDYAGVREEGGDNFAWDWKTGYDILSKQLPNVFMKYYKVRVFSCADWNIKDNSDGYFQVIDLTAANQQNVNLASIAEALSQIARAISGLLSR